MPDVDSLTNYFDLFLAVAATVVALAGFVRWGNRGLERKISEQISEATAQIRKNANGGQSLKDLHDKVDCLVENQQQIKQDVETLRAAVVQLENNVEGIE